MEITFQRAVTAQADLLSDLALEAKGYWGYPTAWLESWREGLRITPTMIQTHHVETVLVGGEVAGFFMLKRDEEAVPWLEHLWLRPAFIGQGVGQAAFTRFMTVCREKAITTFFIISDPNAEGFYLKQGAVRVGEIESLPPKRLLPKLEQPVPPA